VRDIWSGKIKTSDLQVCLLIRNVDLNASGNLSNDTAEIASKLKYHIIKGHEAHENKILRLSYNMGCSS
jgi:hypothetical protein